MSINNRMVNSYCLFRYVYETVSLFTKFSIGIGISIVIVSFYVKRVKNSGILYLLNNYNYNSENDSDDTNSYTDSDNEDDDNYYDDRYKNEYNDLSDNDLSDNIQLKYIDDKTPNGIVKMIYDRDSLCFLYYTNNKNNMPYKYLETVARLFVIANDCKLIYVNYEKELEKIIDENKNLEELKQKKLEEDKLNKKESVEIKSVFAKLKNYKTDEGKSKDEKKWLIPERMNHYRYMGNLRDYEESVELMENLNNEDSDTNDEKNKSVGNDKGFECLDYLSFKRMNQKMNM